MWLQAKAKCPLRCQSGMLRWWVVLRGQGRSRFEVFDVSRSRRRALQATAAAAAAVAVIPEKRRIYS